MKNFFIELKNKIVAFGSLSGIRNAGYSIYGYV